MKLSASPDISELTVELGPRSYPILIGSGLLADADFLQRYLPGQQNFIVSNETVGPLYLERLQASLAAEQTLSLLLKDGEKYKNVTSMETIYSALLEQRCGRDITLVALGGGVVGDMTGFAAATYQRGVEFVQVPTTLLAQVDSSVGGKTGVNHQLGKNMIGAFYQPRAVLIDTDTLHSLPEREYKAGLAEVIKYGLIRDINFLVWLGKNMPQLLQRDATALRYAIYRSCKCKADIVSADETEAGVRAILNFGHTFGHAIETATHYESWLHGEAVGLGMIMALDFSQRSGLLQTADVKLAVDIIRAAGLPDKAPANAGSARQLVELMSVDKKVQRGRIRLVLLKALGDAFITADFDAQLLERTIQDYL